MDVVPYRIKDVAAEGYCARINFVFILNINFEICGYISVEKLIARDSMNFYHPII
jgi:hypothetical protein